ncbi:hypothetical protein GS399_03845 [Pedobacter sp. HMF7647]|uniref:Uncharacterized protein n=1 Tax=Hufsiella arboris TaxID=2695275 RepID=A0A7K1Y6A1_9SPHI|nr:hypothetical protein [Hufsiella arboris]MXV50093.1 hypothetical protein [Hufsiella arboris]
MSFDKNTSMGRTNRATVQDQTQVSAAIDQATDPLANENESSTSEDQNSAPEAAED